MSARQKQLVVQLVTVATAAIAVALFPSGMTPTTTVLLLLTVVAALALSVQRRFQQAARVASDARGLKTELLANVSHELRTPLNAILGYAEILESIPEIATGERQQMVSRILSNAMTLTCAVNNLLEYSSVVTGAGELRPGTVSLAELFDELEPWVDRLLDDKPVAFTWVAEPDLPPVETDRSKLRQVVLNLLANAAKFTAAGEIRLSARRAESGVEIAVSDTGVGMTVSEQRRIFEDFRQLSGSTTRPFGGIGLGLTLAQRLCDLLGASIAVESAPARGTRVAVRLPAIAPARRMLGLEAMRASA